MMLQLTFQQLSQLITQSKNDSPNETCGIIGGKENRARKIFPLPNISPKPQVEYTAEPSALLEAFREIEARGMEHLAIYHSHPATPAYPSPTDIARAFYPDVIYVLISLMNPAQTSVRGFRIIEGQVEEVTLEVENESQRENSRRDSRRANRPHSRRAVATLSRRRPAAGKTGGARR